MLNLAYLRNGGRPERLVSAFDVGIEIPGHIHPCHLQLGGDLLLREPGLDAELAEVGADTTHKEETTMNRLPDRGYCCCFTGHRPEKLGAEKDVVVRLLDEAIAAALDAGYTAFISGAAKGVDLRAADHVVCVCDGYSRSAYQRRNEWMVDRPRS